MAVVADPASANVSVLRIDGVSKTFGGTRALSHVDLEIREDEVHALMGHNGSGKSTLIKCLAGFHHADTGVVSWFGGEPTELGVAADHQAERLHFVHQDLGHVLELSVLDNLAMRGGYARAFGGRIDWRRQEADSRQLLERFGVELDLHRPLSEATPVQRVVVAIVAALQGWEGGRGVLVLDEPTAVLPPHEVSELFRLIAEVKRSGTSILYVSHRLDEIFRVADRVTILRAGKVVRTADVDELTPRSLAALMVGEDVDPDFRIERRVEAAPAPALEARALWSRYMKGVSLTAGRGEIVGVAGLPGSGAGDLPYALAGYLGGDVSGYVRMPAEGAKWCDLARGDIPGLALVPADRARQGVIAELSVAENLTLSVLARLRRRIALSRSAERAMVDQWVTRLDVRFSGPEALISTLSGGNQQKVVMARCLAIEPAVLLLSEPTAGVDIGTRIAIYKLIAAQAERGLSVIVYSTDLGDLLAICSRILVMRDGVVVREMPGAEVSESQLHQAIEGIDDEWALQC